MSFEAFLWFLYLGIHAGLGVIFSLSLFNQPTH